MLTAITPLLPLLISEAPVLIADIVALFKKHPALSPDTLAMIVAQVHSVNTDTATIIAADQAVHPVA
jgi:hypothetical protein